MTDWRETAAERQPFSLCLYGDEIMSLRGIESIVAVLGHRRQDRMISDFAKFVRLPENVKKEKDIFTEEDIQKLEKDGSDAAKIVLMLLSTGMRIGELFGLPLADYHGDYVIGGEKTEAGKNRVIPIRPEGKAYFEYFKQKAKGDLLLCKRQTISSQDKPAGPNEPAGLLNHHYHRLTRADTVLTGGNAPIPRQAPWQYVSILCGSFLVWTHFRSDKTALHLTAMDFRVIFGF